MIEGFAVMHAALKVGDGWSIVDAIDADLRMPWHLNNGYARHKPLGYLHQVVLSRTGVRRPVMVDHVNGDKLDNRRANLRDSGRCGNPRNQTRKAAGTSRFKGVHWAADRGKWRAEITVNRRHIRLGSFDTEIAAQDAYADAALKHFGEFAAPRVERKT